MCSELLTKQSKYTQIEKESLAIIFGITKCRKHLVGHKFTIYTDHKALTYLFGENKGIPMTASARVTRWLWYEYSVQYKPGKELAMQMDSAAFHCWTCVKKMPHQLS